MSEYGFGSVPNELLDRKDTRIWELWADREAAFERIEAKDARIAELEAGGTAYDAGYQAAKADMEERVYRAEAALAKTDKE